MSLRINALISVTDKRGLEKFGRLTNEDCVVISTGGTARELGALGVPSTPVEAVTKFPEMMGGRLKTLHPVLIGGIIANRSAPDHMAKVAEHGMPLVDLVIINLYDFQGKPGIENIDIGGPTNIRAAAKNCEFVTVVVDPDDYDEVIDLILEQGEVPESRRIALAQKAFEHTGKYDLTISSWFRTCMQSGKPVFETTIATH